MRPRERERKLVWRRKKGVARKWDAVKETWFFSGAWGGSIN